MEVAWLADLAGAWWIYPVLYALVVGDAFLVVIPSEIALAALASLSAATGAPALWLLVPVAALGALTGDLLCYAIGRAVGLDRWRWQREGRSGAAIARVQGIVLERPAALIFTARYIPFARIAVNLSVGAARLPLGRYLPLAAAAGLIWAAGYTAIGLAFGATLGEHPIAAALLSIAVALVLGIAVDRISAVVRRRARDR